MATSNSVGKLRDIVEAQDREIDPKNALLKELGDLSGQEVSSTRVLVALHAGTKYHPGTTILKSDKALQEQMFQGSIGLVVGVGAGAFVDAPGAQFHGFKAKVGDWVLCRPSDGLAMNIRQVPCRMFDDVNIRMVISDPEIYW